MQRDDLLSAVRAGETVSGACRRLGLSRDTVYSWRRRHPAFEVALSQALDSRAVRLPSRPAGASLPTREELLRRLDEQSLGGSTRATEILLRHLTAPASDGGDQDPFAKVISVARSR